jgi:hypothetical protein
MKIFDTVTGSNHRLIQDQTVGKKFGAPMIYNELSVNAEHMSSGTHKYAIQGFGIVGRCQHTGILHVILEIPELCQSHSGYVNNVGRIGDRDLRIRAL